MVLSPSNLENHPTGGIVNAIISGNWSILNAIFNPSETGNRLIAMGLLKLDAAALSGLADGRVLRWNTSTQRVEAVDWLALDRLKLESHTKLELVGETVGPTDPTMPADEHANEVVYCSDGDSGSPCLAVSNGTDWKIIALGAAITP